MDDKDRETVACLSCFALNDVSVPFCAECGAPLGMTATLDPMQTIQAQGFLLRKATSRRGSFLILLCVWILNFPAMIGAIIMTIFVFEDGKGFGDFIFFLIGIALTIVTAIILFTVTKNYFMIPKTKSQ